MGKSSKKAISQAKGMMEYAKQKSFESTQDMFTRNQNAFESNTAVLGMLGQEGTYSSPVGGAAQPGYGGVTSAYGAGGTSAGASGLLGGGLNYKAGSMFDTKTGAYSDQSAGPKGANVMGEGQQSTSSFLNPEKFAQVVSQMPVAQIISRQVAEAKGLTDPTSPFRQSMEQSIKNPIIESGAETLRESQRMIKNGMAKGGTARRAAMADAQNMTAIEMTNRQVGQQMWQANLQFESWIRDYQRTTVNAAQAFTNGLGVAQYTSAMNAASAFMVETTIPHAVNYQMQSYKITMDNKKKALWEMIVGGVLMVAGGALSAVAGGAGGGLTDVGAGMMGYGGPSKESTGASNLLSQNPIGGSNRPVSYFDQNFSVPGTPGTAQSAGSGGGMLATGEGPWNK